MYTVNPVKLLTSTPRPTLNMFCRTHPRVMPSTEKEIAMAIKQSLQNFYQGTWHVMVGRKFGCYCTHEQGKFAYFYIGQLGVCVFQTV